MIKNILFDLDGTLLPMNQEAFVRAYFEGMAKYVAPHGYEPKKVTETIWYGTGAMILNDGTKTNEKAFWDYFTSVYGDKALNDMPIFDKFYEEEFDNAKVHCGVNLKSKTLIEKLRKEGFKIILATNPIFPRIATIKRIQWAGLEPEDFDYITTYDNASFGKPNPLYYQEISDKLSLKNEECLMVGNDVTDDMVVTEIGMKAFLVTDCMINTKNKEFSKYPQGNLDDLYDYIQKIKNAD